MKLEALFRFFQSSEAPLYRPTLKSVSPELFPWPCSNTSKGIIWADGYAGALVYACWPSGSYDGRIEYAVLKIENGLQVSIGGPNDEAQLNHPLYGLSESNDPIAEVMNSSFMAETLRRSSKNGKPRLDKACRHYIFFLKENTVEIIAKQVIHLGNFESELAARKVAFDL